MNHRRRTTFALLILVAALAASSFRTSHAAAELPRAQVGCGLPVATPISVPTASTSELPGDLSIIDGLIQHQAAASMMANLGLQRAQDSDVRRTALRIVESQAGEVQLLRAWRASWYPNAAASVATEGTAAISTTMSSLCNTHDFDRTFLTAMLEHDRVGLEIVQLWHEKAEHDELRDFLASYLETTERDMRSMQALLDHLPNVS